MEDRRTFALTLIAQARREGRRALDEWTAKRLLQAYGIRTPKALCLAANGQGIDDVATHLAPPYVLKIMSSEVLHKSDIGGVRLGLQDVAAVGHAMVAMRSALQADAVPLDGFLVEETAPRGHDVVVGAYRDPGFGPVLMFGLGGIFVEILRDVSFRICPVHSIDAQEMVRELRGAPLLAGARGGLAVPEPVFVDLLMRVGGPQGLLADLHEELAEIDLNPVIVSAQGAVAVDARMILA